jgi:hypothetical protein
MICYTTACLSRKRRRAAIPITNVALDYMDGNGVFTWCSLIVRSDLRLLLLTPLFAFRRNAFSTMVSLLLLENKVGEHGF